MPQLRLALIRYRRHKNETDRPFESVFVCVRKPRALEPFWATVGGTQCDVRNIDNLWDFVARFKDARAILRPFFYCFRASEMTVFHASPNENEQFHLVEEAHNRPGSQKKRYHPFGPPSGSL